MEDAALDHAITTHARDPLFVWLEGDEWSPKLSSLKHVKGLGFTNTRHLPPQLFRMTWLEVLRIQGCTFDLPTLVKNLLGFDALRVLFVDGDGTEPELAPLPSELLGLGRLEELDLEACGISELPKRLGDLLSLKILRLDQNPIDALPDSNGRLRNLEELSLYYAWTLARLPETIGGLSSLRSLRLDGTQLRRLPASVAQLELLQILTTSHARLTSLPELGRLGALEILDASANQLTDLPAGLDHLPFLHQVDVRENPLPAKLAKSLPRGWSVDR